MPTSANRKTKTVRQYLQIGSPIQVLPQSRSTQELRKHMIMDTGTKSIIRLTTVMLVTVAILPLLIVHTNIVRDALFDPLLSSSQLNNIVASKMHFQTPQAKPISKTKTIRKYKKEIRGLIDNSNNDNGLAFTGKKKEEVSESYVTLYEGDKKNEEEQWVDGCYIPTNSNIQHEDKSQDVAEESDQPPTGLVVVLAVAPDDRWVRWEEEQRICFTVPNQIEYFLESQGFDMLFLVQEEDDGSNWTVKRFKGCFGLIPHPTEKSRLWKNLDGTTLEVEPFVYAGQTSITASEERQQDPVTIYLAKTRIEYPKYIQNDMSLLKKPISPKSCESPRKYIQATRWYTRELLHLGILEQYDYFVKLDTDIIFVDTVPFSISHDLKQKGAVFAHTAEYTNGNTCAMGIQKAIQNYTSTAQKSLPRIHDGWKGTLCSSSSPQLQKDVDLYYTNLIVGSTEFFQSPWVLEFSNYLNEVKEGFFHYRWTDQIFWHMAMGLFLDSFEDYVEDYTNLRCMPHPNCWMSSYNFDRYGQNAWHNCDNGGYFLHPKDYKVPGDAYKQPKTRSSVWNDASRQPPRFQSSYQHDCSGK